MKTTITCLTCGHKISLKEDERIRLDTGLTHRPDGGHQYTVGISVGVGRKGFDA